jgi:stringent starvation protein B
MDICKNGTIYFWTPISEIAVSRYNMVQNIEVMRDGVYFDKDVSGAMVHVFVPFINIRAIYFNKDSYVIDKQEKEIN